MAWDITVILEDQPGALASLGEATGSAGLNIDGVSATLCEGRGVIHLLVEDGAAARTVLDGVGLVTDGVREVLVVDIEDRPGALGATTRRLADAGVNINLTYLATATRLVLGVDDLDAARAAL